MRLFFSLIFFLLLICSELTSAALADSWGEFMNCRVVDPTGKYYVVFTKADPWPDDPGRGGPVDYVIAQRQGDDPVAPASDRIDYEQSQFIRDPHVRVRDGDTITGQGRLERAPLYTLVSSTGAGFVTADVHGYNYGDATARNAVIHVAADGTVVFRKSWDEIFTAAELPLFTTTAGGRMWLRAVWIDDNRQEVIIVGRAHRTPDDAASDKGEMNYLFRGVSLSSGDVTRRTSGVALSALQSRSLGALSAAIPLSLELSFPEVERIVEEIAADANVPDYLRQEARHALEEHGKVVRERQTSQRSEQ